MRSDKSTQIALGGVFSALCLLLMFLSSMIPFSSFALPMLSGMMLAVVVIENGYKTALLVYISVSLLSVFVVPDFDAKVIFILFFGYYPILKPFIERVSRKPLALIIKLLVFNAAMVGSYFISIKLFGVDEALQNESFFSQYGIPMMLAGVNFSFLIYDSLLTKYIILYIRWFRPTFLRK